MLSLIFFISHIWKLADLDVFTSFTVQISFLREIWEHWCKNFEIWFFRSLAVWVFGFSCFEVIIFHFFINTHINKLNWVVLRLFWNRCCFSNALRFFSIPVKWENCRYKSLEKICSSKTVSSHLMWLQPSNASEAS